MTHLEKLIYQYQGFKNQPNLWLDDSFFPYPQVQIPFCETLDLSDIDTTKHQRLGKLAEVFYQKNIEALPDYRSLAHNLQLQIDKHQTIGELDFICDTPTGIQHIELTCKFYLYKPNIPYEIDRWVGPNLRDSLVKKLTKLKDHQFPKLYHKVTQKLLRDLEIPVEHIQQSVHFKAQLYVPLSLQNHTFPNINNDCIKGYYISHKEIDYLFPLALYHIPKKQDWLIDPKHNDEWVTFVEAKPQILEQISVQHSPLVWIKRDGIFERIFVTFWVT